MACRIWSLRYPNKGYVISLDVMLGMLLVSIALTVSLSMTEESVTEEINLKRLGYDIISVLDYSGVLGTFNSTSIENNLTMILPHNVNMSLTISKYSTSGGLINSIGINEIKENYYSGKWVFANATNFFKADFRIKFR